MGMSTHIIAFTPDTDKEFQRHKKILMACHEGKVRLSPDTAEYFGYDHPIMSLMDDKLSVELTDGEHYEKWSDGEGSSGFEVDLTKLPAGVTKLRFYNNW